MSSQQETRAPVVNVAESLALLLAPMLFVGGAAAAFAGRESLVGGLFVGGLFGAMLLSLRRGFYAVRTEDGIERRLRTEASADNPWLRLANVEYPETYDRVLALGLVVVGVGAFALVPTVADPHLAARLAAVGLFGIVGSLLIYGVART